MDDTAAGAVAITEFPLEVKNDGFDDVYESCYDERDVLPSTAIATAAITELAKGKLHYPASVVHGNCTAATIFINRISHKASIRNPIFVA